MTAKVFFASLLVITFPGQRALGSGTDNEALRPIRIHGNDLFNRQQYRQALEVYEKGQSLALEQGDFYSAARFLSNIGSSRFAMLQYRAATKAFLESRRLARHCEDFETVAQVSSNLSSLYLQLGEWNASLKAVEDALSALRRHGFSKHAANISAQAALVFARGGDMEAAVRHFRQYLFEADGLRKDGIFLPLPWDLLGYEFLERRQFEAAERAFLEAFRLRSLNHLPSMEYSYYSFGMLSLATGEADRALNYFDRALAETRKRPGPLPFWRIRYQRGRALRTLGLQQEALAEFRAAVESVRRWRLELLPADSLVTNSGLEVQQVYAAFVETATHLYFKTRRFALLREAFEVVEENRAVGLRASLREPSDWQRRLPDEYWDTLAQVRSSEAALLAEPGAEALGRLDRLQYRLMEIEAAAGGMRAFSPCKGLLATTIDSLDEDAAYLGFHLGETESSLWVATREGAELHKLPGRRRLAELAGEFRNGVRLGRSESSGLGRRIYTELFGGLTPKAASKRRWLMALDGPLFEMPFAALVTGGTPESPIYFVEQRTAQLSPGAFATASRMPAGWEGGFLGVADPVYNSADERRRRLRDSRDSGVDFFRFLPRMTGEPREIEMPRLAGSRSEVRRCSRAWDPATAESVLLEGGHATTQDLYNALASRPSILHIATHFVAKDDTRKRGAWSTMGPASATPEGVPYQQVMISLSLRPAGGVDVLSPAVISRWRFPLNLVVLSGCASGRSGVLPGNGLMGLVRAWLMAGAGSVAASIWPTPDDRGDLFTAFYRCLRNLVNSNAAGPAAAALRQAQVEMLRSGSWRAEPRYWAAYFVMGKE